ncbi:YbhB/YbcL family Raf kinase inhibitor-like protein [Shewanella oneidensis MR-1]|uniref:Phosphatidylethanolamine-binding protein n=1 Tax=Shewanella oneidensis (strain ATCC 700550 / JCM 31522 / CIP 106686 / LMG 19005 / NCIMB 14063 / MR-1) TaxID=211586 RepID=Q8EFL5_SHEON|nr:YbhB/YbcL family Raf kinase inhibitor-like protein [Shewanella oneidensis]AAN55007.1 phosphatidylethanolamine-binding protein [Shewanella oneidensis MR-1]MDX5996285.1 YbhB/YbcL family Raf kinase inhibitor-like protein [Shewanella oneidensis]MEE2029654.1 hypothetical protein [Shewanella oneidensis]QKG96600.1 YbhB/YbcL family Raf kinase inhibitor-like protein [Shewanella oneidensis MR-1]
MKQRFYTDYLFKFSLVASVILFNTASASVEGKPVKTTPANSSKTTFSVQSNLAPDVSIPADYYWDQFGCSGDNLAPRLTWEHAPKGTKSFAVTFYDKDAPTGSGFWHRVVYNIPSQVNQLEGGINGGKLPVEAIEANTDLGKPGFFGPCPPKGREHRYVWTVHALDVAKLPVDANASPALVGFYLWQHRLAEANLTVLAGSK